MSAAYWLGFFTLPALALTAWIALMVIGWIRWWFIDPNTTFRGGWGYHHEVQSHYPEDDRWGFEQHVHYWPTDTPRWLGRWLEPMRIWLCLRSPEYRVIRPGTPKGGDDRG